MMNKKERKLYECLRCGWAWLSNMNPPRVCAKCHSPYWNIPKASKGADTTGEQSKNGEL
jgi:hypothetical protein